MSRPLVSILVCNHNYARYLRAAIESALSQSYSRTEVIVVDDGSTDESREVITSYAGHVTAVLKDQGGQGSAVNAGLTRCRGELVAFLDSDDVFVSTKVERVVELTEDTPGAILYYHRLQTMDSEGRRRGRPWPHDVRSGQIGRRVWDAGGWWPRPTNSALVFRRSFLERIRPFPEEDRPGRVSWPDAFAGDLAPFLGEIRGVPDTLAYYRVHGANRGMISPELQMGQFLFEAGQLVEALRRLGQPVAPLRLERHLGIAQAMATVHPGSALVRAVWLSLRCPSLSARGKVVEAGLTLLRALRRTNASPNVPA